MSDRPVCLSHFERASQVIAGGVNSPVRAFGYVDDHPVFISRAKGSQVFDSQGRGYIDYVNSWGAVICGHACDQVVADLTARAALGLSFGAPTEAETQLACEIRTHMPSLQVMRFVSSGTEACMSAVRLARSYTSRSGVLKFEGHYHGHSDSLLSGAGSGLATSALPISAGVTQGAIADTITISYQDMEALEHVFAQHGDDLAAVICELIVGNCGFIKPDPEFLVKLVSLCEHYGVLLIADEVMTGFRVAMGGAQSVYGLHPDITVLGKVVGGGMPLACYGGSAEIMAQVAPVGKMYQAGTLSGHPLAVQCGLTTLKILADPQNWRHLSHLSDQLTTGLLHRAQAHGMALSVDYQGGMFGYAWSPHNIRHKQDMDEASLSHFRMFFQQMLARGIYLPPSPYESCFLSLAHDDEDIQKTLDAADEVFVQLAQNS